MDLKKRFSEEQIIGFLQQAEAGIPVKELCRQHGFSDGSFYNWRAKFGGMSVPDAKRLKDLEVNRPGTSRRSEALNLGKRRSHEQQAFPGRIQDRSRQAGN